ncbi:MAG: DNA primase [Bacteroidota bacterium]
MIHPSTIEEIKNRIDIVEVVGDFVSLKRSGSSYKAKSPFTNEKTPSFYVVPSKGIFKDFSSGKGGDAITFVMEVDGLSYVEALKYLAGRYGIEIKEDEQSDEAQEAQNRRESLFIVLGFANSFFSESLVKTEQGRSIGLSYFRERGFTDETIEKFSLGYSPDIWDGFLKAATEKGYQKELLVDAGLVVDKENKTYDRFRNRVMFPIQNISGKTIAFGARKLSNADKSAKYINSPETELYNKSKVLYGIFHAKQEIRKEDNCFLVEGYTDVISMHQAGIENVVSSSGTALTEDQTKLIRRYTENVTVLFDGDSAGIRASLRGIDLLLEGDLNVRAVALPEGQDPDSYAKDLGAVQFREYVAENAQDIIRFKVKVLLEESGDDPLQKASVIKDIVASITKINDPVKRNVYIKECSELLQISEFALIAEQNKILLANSKQRKNAERFRSEQADLLATEEVNEQIEDQLDIAKIIEFQEKESIRVLVNYGRNKIETRELGDQYLVKYFLSEADEINFTNKSYAKIVQLFKDKLQDGEVIDTSFLLQYGDEEIKKIVVDLSTDKYEISENWKEKYKIHVPTEADHLKDVTYTNILRLKFRIIEQLIEKNTEKLKKADSTSATDEILDEVMELKEIGKSIAKTLGNVLVG